MAPVSTLHCTLYSMQMAYVGDTGSYGQVSLSFFVICLVLVLLLTGVRMFNWSRRATRTMEESTIGCGHLARFFVFLAGVWSRVYFWFLFAFTCYWLLFYKLQDRVFTLLPADTDDVYDTLEAMLWVVWACHVVRVRP